MLSILEYKERIVKTIQENQVSIVVGETGSGKTTQLPRFLYEACFSEEGIIGVTEPRRIAAMSVAGFVAQQMGFSLSKEVGYYVRFDNCTDLKTQIKFMTDGILLQEIQMDSELSKYSVIMIDEAHERSQNIDFALGLLKALLSRRRDLKVIISSATIDVEKFSKYFNKAPIVEITSRTYPVEIVWSDRDYSDDEIIPEVMKRIGEIHLNQGPGDILVFLTGAEEINFLIKCIEKKGRWSNLIALPAHGGLSPEEQMKIFQDFPGKRKVIVATNIAETSITIDGVVYVVDTGYIKQHYFHPESGIQSLSIVPHSQAGCNQRSGRAGRTQPGICYRLYPRQDFEKRPKFTEPEIKRSSLANVVLAMENLGIKDIENFDFLDFPDRKLFHEAYETLIALGAIKRNKKGLTELGKAMARLPLEPTISRMLLEAEKYGCVKEITTVAAFLSVKNIFFIPPEEERRYEAYSKHKNFKDTDSDALTYLKIWEEYQQSGYDAEWCCHNFLNSRSLQEIKNIQQQLLEILEEYKIKISSTGNQEAIKRSVAAGLIYLLLEYGSRHWYQGVMRDYEEKIFIHPSSSLCGSRSFRWIVTAGIVETTKVFARVCSKVEPEWLPELLPDRFSFGSYQEIKSYKQGDNFAVAVRPIIYQAGEDAPERIGFQEVKVAIEEAKRIQGERIQRAKIEGLVKLTIRKESAEFVADYDSQFYTLIMMSDIEPEGGHTYYCQIDSLLNTFDPQFKMFDFGEEKNVITREEAKKLLSQRFQVKNLKSN